MPHSIPGRHPAAKPRRHPAIPPVRHAADHAHEQHKPQQPAESRKHALRGCAARRSWASTWATLPAVLGPGTAGEPSTDDDGAGQRQPELHYQPATLGAPAQLAVQVAPGVGAFNHPASAHLDRCRHSTGSDLSGHPPLGEDLPAGLVVVAGGSGWWGQLRWLDRLRPRLPGAPEGPGGACLTSPIAWTRPAPWSGLARLMGGGWWSAGRAPVASPPCARWPSMTWLPRAPVPMGSPTSRRSVSRRPSSRPTCSTGWLPVPGSGRHLPARSPVHSADRITCSVLLWQGLYDTIVPPTQTQLMVKALICMGIPHRYLSFQDEGHGLRRPAASSGPLRPSCPCTWTP
jgi:Prolyl oligopeptidase family